MRRKFASSLLIIALVLGAAALIYFSSMPDDLQQQAEGRLRVQLQWIPTAQFLGIYVALEKGYFRDEGLDIELLHGGPNVDPLRRLIDGDCDVAIATADQVVMRDALAQAGKIRGTQGLHVLGTIFDRSVAAFMLHGTGPINSVRILRGKTVGVYPNYDTDHILDALLQQSGVSRSEVNVVAFPRLADWYGESIDAFPVYLFNEPIDAATKGVGYSILDPQEFGVVFYSDTIVVTAEGDAAHGEALRRFMKALRRGWTAARQDPQLSVEMMMKLESAAILGRGGEQEVSLEKKKASEVVRYLGQGPIVLKPEVDKWNQMVTTLKAIGVIDSTYDGRALISAISSKG